MTAREFAEKYQDQKIKYTQQRADDVIRSKGQSWSDNDPIGVCIGYDINGRIIYIPSDEFVKTTGKTGKTGKWFRLTSDKYKGQSASSIHCLAGDFNGIIPFDDREYKPRYKAKEISAYPQKCPSCNSPAYIGMLKVDCSNQDCKQKFSTQDGTDLFIPLEMRDGTKTKNKR